MPRTNAKKYKRKQVVRYPKKNRRLPYYLYQSQIKRKADAFRKQSQFKRGFAGLKKNTVNIRRGQRWIYGGKYVKLSDRLKFRNVHRSEAEKGRFIRRSTRLKAAGARLARRYRANKAAKAAKAKPYKRSNRPGYKLTKAKHVGAAYYKDYGPRGTKFNYGDRSRSRNYFSKGYIAGYGDTKAQRMSSWGSYITPQTWFKATKGRRKFMNR